MKPTTRKIRLTLSIDWEDYEDVDPQIILSDAIIELAEGVTITVSED